jgi:hypothetical protein
VYKSFLVEDDSYFWTLSRYIHLNPCRGAPPLSEKPDGWAHYSYRGYARRTARHAFVQCDVLYEAWRGKCGGKTPTSAYRRYVAEGLSGAAESPLKSALREWVIGSQEFLKRMAALTGREDKKNEGRLRRGMGAATVDEVMAAIADMHEVEPGEYVGFRSPAAGREMAALL